VKKLIEFFAEQKLFGDLLTIAILVLGIISLTTVRREAFPNISFDIISVVTVFPGASPEEVEQLITNPLEQDLKEIDGIKKMTSTTVEGRSLILLQLDIDSTDAEKAKSDVRDVVDTFSGNLPDGAERPAVRLLETKQTPIIEVAVSGELAPLELRQIAKRLEKEFERVSGVASVKAQGLEDIEFHVEADPKKLQAFRVSLEDLIQALRTRNVAVPGGTVEGSSYSGQLEQVVRTSGQFTTVSEVGNTVLRANEMARTIRVKDVARVTETLAKPSVISHTDGVQSIRLTLLKKEKADAIDTVDAVQAKLAAIGPTLDKRVKLTLVNDISEYVRRRLGVLFGNLTVGLLLVLLLLPMFLPFRFALLVAIGEPFALLGTLLVFNTMDIGLNMILVIGLILVSGVLVDDGIVVVENVARLIREGMEPKVAAIRGAQQMWVPIMASAMTTIVAFLPMASMSGIFGKFIQYIPLGVIVPILISLFENFFIMPHHIATWLRIEDFENKNPKGIFGPIRNWTENLWYNFFMPWYLRMVGHCMRLRYAVLGAAMVLLVACVGLGFGVMKFVLFPPEGIEVFIVRVQAPVGMSLEGTAALVAPIEKIIHELPKEEVKNTITNIGIHQQDPNDPNTRRGTEFAQVVVYMTPETSRARTAAQIIESLREKVGTQPGVRKLTFERVNPGPPVGKPVSIGVRAEDYPAILPAVNELKAIVSKIPGVSDVEDSYLLGKQQLDVQVKYAEAGAAGLTVGGIGTAVRATYEGVVATTIRTLDEEVKVRVLMEKDLRQKAQALEALKVGNLSGALVPLTAVAEVGQSQNIAMRSHEDNAREIRVTANVDTKTVSASQANDKVRLALPSLQAKFPGVVFDFGGEDEDTQESMQSLLKAFVLAVVGIFLILILTFKTLLQPLVILITIPLGLISVVITFFLHGMPLSFLGMVGMVGLSGIIVNSAIVFVEFVNEARRDGFDRFESILEAARQRARPIFLTTVTTVVSVMPTAYGIGGLDKFVVPVALALGWGLFVGSFLTLFLLPAALSILDDVAHFGNFLFRKLAPRDR
jgi:multidrug efflux pump subunit AcrB